MRSSGTLMCLASGAAFGAMAIFGKLAYGEGATVGTLLAVRFSLAAAVFWAIVLAGRGAGQLRALRGRDVRTAIALGACGYALQAGCYFAALTRIDASLLSLMLYTYPAIVAAAAVALGRERIDSRRVLALALASGGLVCVVAGAGTGAIDAVGAVLGLTAACVYTTYILVGEGVAGRMAPMTLSAIVCTGAAVSLTAGGSLLGEFRPGALSLAGRGWLACLGGGAGGGGLGGVRGVGGGGGGDRPVLRRAAPRRPDVRVDPLDGRAGGHGGARRGGLRRAPEPGADRRRHAGDRRRAGAARLARAAAPPGDDRRRARARAGLT